MATIASLDIALSANSARLQQDLNQAQRKTQTFAQRVNASTRSMTQGYNRMAAGMTAVLGVMGASALLKNADQLQKNADAAGMSFEAYQRLQFGYEQAGISQTAFAKSSAKLGTNMLNLERGSATAVDAFGRLGLTYDQLSAMSPEERMLAVTDALGQVEDASERAALAQQLLGREFATTAIDTTSVREAGEGLIVLDDAAGRASEATNDAFNRLSTNSGNLATNLLTEALPAITTVVEALSNFSQDHPTMTKVLLGLAALGAAVAIAGGPITLIAAAITAAIVVFQNWDTIVATLADKWDDFGVRFPAVAKLVEGGVDAILAPFRLLKTLFDEVMQLVTGDGDLVDRLKRFATNITTALIDNNPVVRMAQGLADAVKAPLNAVIGLFENMVNRAIDVINDVTNFTIPVPDWLGGDIVIGGTDFSPIDLPAFKDGGAVHGAGTGTSDSILARLSNGEFVMNAASTARFRPFLEEMNNGNLPAFRDGGSVGNSVATRFSPEFTQALAANADTRVFDSFAKLVLEGIRIDREEVSAAVTDGFIEAFQGAPQTAEEEQASFHENAAAAFVGDLKSSFAQAMKDGDWKSFFHSVLDSFTSKVIDSFVEGLFAPLEESLTTLVSQIFSGQGGLGESINGLMGGLLGTDGGGGAFSSIFGQSFGSFLGFSKGGLVPSTPYSKLGQDSVPAMLTPGEVVIPVSEVGKQGGNQTFNLNITGNIDTQTRKTVLEMMPQISRGVNQNNKELGR